ncbi:MAG: hypothetical protein HC837_13240 [Chloroflexaceae bacterium]|nr:hypothetical protein [Chloroflexaceae bacterium]
MHRATYGICWVAPIWLGEAGVAAQPLSISLLFETLQTVTGALLLTALSLFFWGTSDAVVLWTLLLLPLLVAYSWPQLLQYPIDWLFRRSGSTATHTMLSRRALLLLLPGYAAGWTICGLSLYLLIWSVYPLPLTSLPQVMGMFSLAWALGFLSFITPSGLGVREGVLSYLLSLLIPVPMALLLALMARVWLTVAELLCFGLVFFIRRQEGVSLH